MKHSVLILLVPFLLGCTGNHDAKSEMENYDWTPEVFKKKHPDEWAVVKPAINIQQKEGDIDFGKIDKLVKDYMVKKKISLPSDVAKKVQRIEEVCKTKFDISGYDDSNMGMHVANGTRGLFEMYVNWLYEQEAAKILKQKKIVDLAYELKLYENLNDAMYDVCDSVAFCMEGSGGWIGGNDVQGLSTAFKKCLCQAIIGAPFEKKRELDVPLDLFDKECKVLNDNYEPYMGNQPKDVSHIVNRFKKAFHSWYAYRKSVAAGLKDEKFKKAYESITYSFARTHFLHLKNRYRDIGMMNGDMEELCLDEDCSNKELLEYNYETKYKELFGNL